MPKLYNVPAWYSSEYESAMASAVRAIEATFGLPLAQDPSYLACLRDRADADSLALLGVLEGSSPIRWMPPGHTLGMNVIRVRNPLAFRFILPSYMRSAVELFDTHVSPAEASAMPLLLAERLRFPISAEEPPPEVGGLCEAQLRTVRSVLEALALRRGQSEQTAALEAIELFWHRFEPWTS